MPRQAAAMMNPATTTWIARDHEPERPRILDAAEPAGRRWPLLGGRRHHPGSEAGVAGRGPRTRWLWFGLQLLGFAALEETDDIVRGNLDPPDVRLAATHAWQVTHLEQAHGFFIEPAVQLWARHLSGLGGLLSYGNLIRATDFIYAAGQTIVPFLLALWIIRRHRASFPLLRNIAVLTALLSLAGYELYPLAPPRLTTGLMYGHHLFQFQNTVQNVIGDGKLNGVPIAYNAYSAMPSLHVAMALFVAGSVAFLAGSLLVRLLVGLYPLLMLFTVVVTANHYLLDAAGGAAAVVLATLIALAGRRALAGIRRHVSGPLSRALPRAEGFAFGDPLRIARYFNLRRSPGSMIPLKALKPRGREESPCWEPPGASDLDHDLIA